MTTAVQILENLRRPSLLIRAARHGVAEYDRNKGLSRLIESTPGHGTEAVLAELLSTEAELETDRKAGLATYSVLRHIEVLVALMGEARHLARSRQMS